MAERTRVIGVFCAIIIAALYVVGLVSGTLLRHVVQTAPIWIGAVLAFRASPHARWFALPFFFFWLGIVVLIWLFLVGWAQVVHGTFTPPEVAMTVVMGAASLGGIVASLRGRGRVAALAAVGAFLAGAVLQFAAFRLSLLPGISTR